MTTTNPAQKPQLTPDFVSGLKGSRWHLTCSGLPGTVTSQLVLGSKSELQFGVVSESTLRIFSIAEETAADYQPAPVLLSPSEVVGPGKSLHKWKFEAVYTVPALSPDVVAPYIDSPTYGSFKGEIMWAWGGPDKTDPTTKVVTPHHRGIPQISMVVEGEFPGATEPGSQYYYGTYC